MDKAIIISGGVAEDEVVRSVLRRLASDDTMVICADAGLNVCDRVGVIPDIILGDFDSVDSEVLDKYRLYAKTQFYNYPAKKDFTDTELACDVAINEGAKQIVLLGATGRRMDHTLGVIYLLEQLENKGVTAYIVDQNNVIRCLLPDRYDLHEFEYGKYVSFIPLSDAVEGINIKGVAYEVENARFLRTTTLGISNEITEEEAFIDFKSGTLLMIKSQD
ncbi:MAG: thiamine diphosphokinase [Lachnospiraceae bacterium]|nr:thiamine diphosphokinase [Lachnospiraceae bacterium]